MNLERRNQKIILRPRASESGRRSYLDRAGHRAFTWPVSGEGSARDWHIRSLRERGSGVSEMEFGKDTIRLTVGFLAIIISVSLVVAGVIEHLGIGA